jgi:proteasome-associated ATPase
MTVDADSLKSSLDTYAADPSEEARQAMVRLIHASPYHEQIDHFLLRDYSRHVGLREELDDLRGIQQQLQSKIETLLAPPGNLGILKGIRTSGGPARADVVVGARRIEVAISDDLDPGALQIGDEVVLNSDCNCIISHRGAYAAGGEIADVDMELDGGRLVLKTGGGSVVVEKAAGLHDTPVKPGTVVLYDPALRLAFQVVEREDRDQHFLDEIPDTSFADIGGLEEAVEKIREKILFPIQYPDKHRRYRIKPVRGMLFWGPPGCGKTMLGRAVANEVSRALKRKARFMVIKAAEPLSMWVGESERYIREVFSYARKVSAESGDVVIIFYDEIDAVARARSGAGGHGSSAVGSTIVPTLLSELDGLEEEGNTGVILIAATNRPDVLDSAFMRAMRMDIKIEVPRPGRAAARSIMERYLTPDLLPSNGSTGSGPSSEELIEQALAQLFAPADDNTVATLVFRDGQRQPILRKDLLSGALLERIISEAQTRALMREIDMGAPDGTDGIRAEDLSAALDEAFASEAKILRPHNVRDYLALPADRDVVAVQPATGTPGAHTYLRTA